MGCPSFRMFWITSFFAMYFRSGRHLACGRTVCRGRRLRHCRCRCNAKEISISLPGEVNALDSPLTGTTPLLSVCVYSCGQTTFDDNQKRSHFEHSLDQISGEIFRLG